MFKDKKMLKYIVIYSIIAFGILLTFNMVKDEMLYEKVDYSTFMQMLDKKEVKDAITVAELIVQEDVETPQYVTVSVNDDFIDKAEFETYALKEGDSVEFLYFMGGGR